jgi:hypothetical protein
VNISGRRSAANPGPAGTPGRVTGEQPAGQARHGNGTVAAHRYEVPVSVLEGDSRGGEAVQLTWMDIEPSMLLAEGAIANTMTAGDRRR